MPDGAASIHIGYTLNRSLVRTSSTTFVGRHARSYVTRLRKSGRLTVANCTNGHVGNSIRRFPDALIERNSARLSQWNNGRAHEIELLFKKMSIKWPSGETVRKLSRTNRTSSATRLSILSIFHQKIMLILLYTNDNGKTCVIVRDYR